MIVHCIIINGEPQTVELFIDLRTMTERFEVLQAEGKDVTVTSSEI